MTKTASSSLTGFGRVLFALAMLGFGVQDAVAGHLALGVPPIPSWIVPSAAGNHALAILAAVLLIAISLALLAAWRLRAASLLLGIFLLAGALLYLTHLHAVIVHDGPRTNFLQPLTFAGAAFVLYGLAGGGGKFLAVIGRIFFGVSMVLYSVAHFRSTQFIMSLIPAWIPFHLFWTVAIAIGFIAAGMAILTGVAARAASLCLFAMFFVWLVLLYIPPWIAQPRNADSLTDVLVVLGLCGASLLLAADAARSSL